MTAEAISNIPVGEHPIPERHAFHHDNRPLMAIIGVLVVALVVVGLIAFDQPNNNAAARAKAVKLRAAQPERPRGYLTPALKWMCGMGFVSTIGAFLIGFVPPSQFHSGGTLVYVLLVAGGVGIMGPGIPLLLDRFKKPHWKTTASSTGTTARVATTIATTSTEAV